MSGVNDHTFHPHTAKFVEWIATNVSAGLVRHISTVAR